MAEESAVQVESKAATLVEPDLDFVRELKAAGGDTLKKCFQCATCSVVCGLSNEPSPFHKTSRCLQTIVCPIVDRHANLTPVEG